MLESEPYSLTLDLSWTEDEEGVLVVSGCASVPKPDRENEVITKEAIEAALPSFMKLPILHLDHTERPVGLITDVGFEGDEFHIRSPIKDTPDCRDVRDRIRSGDLAQFSIYGRRLKGSSSCRLHPERRSEPCLTYELALDSVSICPKNNAIQADSYVEHNGDSIVVKSMNSDSAPVHETADGSMEKIDMVDTTDAPAESAPTGNDFEQQVVGALTSLSERMSALEQAVEEMTSVGPDDIEKADEDYGDAEEYGDDAPDIQEQVSTIAEGLTMVLQELQELKDQMGGGDEVQKAELEDEEDEYPDDGYEDDEDPEEEEVEKGCAIKKAFPDLPEEIRKAIASIPALNDTIQQLREDNDILRKAVLELEETKPRDRKVIVDQTLVKSEDIVQKAKTPESPSGDTNPALLMAGQF